MPTSSVGIFGLIPAHAGKTVSRSAKPRPIGAHPRSRGENLAAQDPYGRETGSSPLTRGKQIDDARALARARLIPAHAGKTCCSIMWGRSFPAHPRSRGENENGGKAWNKATGSSPLTRGKRHLLPAQLDSSGLIPAHAGKTSLSALCAASRAAHPRSRGENSSTRSCPSYRRGSSPLTRGKLPRELVDIVPERLIPAHAGKTVVYCLPSSAVAAHPRSRGENMSPSSSVTS